MAKTEDTVENFCENFKEATGKMEAEKAVQEVAVGNLVVLMVDM